MCMCRSCARHKCFTVHHGLPIIKKRLLLGILISLLNRMKRARTKKELARNLIEMEVIRD